MTTIIHDTTEAVHLCQEYHLYLKPIAKMTISVALPQLKMPGKSISNWEVMERLKNMVHPELFSSLRISKSTMDFIRFEGEVENRGIVKSFVAKLDGKSIKLSGFTDILKVRAAENKVDFPTRHDWDSFFRDAKDMNETVPGERPDTIHLEGLPCKWFALKDSSSDRPSEAVLKIVFENFGKIRNVDIPMLDPYREEMTGKNFNTFSFGGHLNFEGYIQYEDHTGFVKAMDTLRGMKLMYKGDDGKAVACNIKVNFDTTKHLSESSQKKRQQERLKLQELERQKEEQKRKQKEEEERRKEEERRQRELEEEEKEKRREEKLRKREQKLKEREEKKNQKKVKKLQEEEQKKLHLKIAMEERKLLLAQRNLQSIRLVAELLSRAKALKQQQLEQEKAELAQKQKAELARLQQLEEKRRQQEVELRRVESEKARALELQRKERELRDRLLGNLLKKSTNTDCQEETGPEINEEPAGDTAPQVCETQTQLNGVTRRLNRTKPVPDAPPPPVTRGRQESEPAKREERPSGKDERRGQRERRRSADVSGSRHGRGSQAQNRSRGRSQGRRSARSRSGSRSGRRRSRSGRRYSRERSRSYRRSQSRNRRSRGRGHSNGRRGQKSSGRSHRYSHGQSSSSSSRSSSSSSSRSRNRSRSRSSSRGERRRHSYSRSRRH
ncbi:A-kinase anchor protein 17A [Astyanax mexicanus]|uniref:A-kinase anchor protein 17A n=2 Tax=Astyanax mexicanus TaxID=7994 RepID=A0A8B9KBT8_ASTMX|nr:A-kinase anchor protein 17A [Astyanax mexicanus]KAG9270969.1 A-kinase anchor protein 17A [Astyanax mexicanus]